MPLDPKALEEMEAEYLQKKAEAKEIMEWILGRPVTEPIVENCWIDLSDTEDLKILYDFWDAIGKSRSNKS